MPLGRADHRWCHWGKYPGGGGGTCESCANPGSAVERNSGEKAPTESAVCGGTTASVSRLSTVTPESEKICESSPVMQSGTAPTGCLPRRRDVCCRRSAPWATCITEHGSGPVMFSNVHRCSDAVEASISAPGLWDSSVRPEKVESAQQWHCARTDLEQAGAPRMLRSSSRTGKVWATCSG